MNGIENGKELGNYGPVTRFKKDPDSVAGGWGCSDRVPPAVGGGLPPICRGQRGTCAPVPICSATGSGSINHFCASIAGFRMIDVGHDIAGLLRQGTSDLAQLAPVVGYVAAVTSMIASYRRVDEGPFS